jgi:transaldolase
MKTSLPKIVDGLLNSFEYPTKQAQSKSFWQQFVRSGTRLWLDTGDIPGALNHWSNEFEALTTNNTLLNNEIQKGLYDRSIEEIATVNSQLKNDELVKEVALTLNALHGMRLVNIFNAKVSVELHTDLAHDIQGIIYDAKRLFELAPRYFIIKVPFTAAGLIGARKLHNMGIPVNFTLQFSARQNLFTALIAQPAYSNVFLGRIGTYISSNGLGSPDFIGEKVCCETQHILHDLNDKALSHTRLIGASIRESKQLALLSGLDVLTIPLKVVQSISDETAPINSHLSTPDLEIKAPHTSKQLGLDWLWKVNELEYTLAMKLSNKLPDTGDELEAIARSSGCRDLFPEFTKQDIQQLQTDGKIPSYNYWNVAIENKSVGLDALLNKAGLLSFATDQHTLDNRIRNILTL